MLELLRSPVLSVWSETRSEQAWRRVGVIWVGECLRCGWANMRKCLGLVAGRAEDSAKLPEQLISNFPVRLAFGVSVDEGGVPAVTPDPPIPRSVP